MWPAYELHVTGAVEIAAPPETPWEGGMGCHASPQKMWRLGDGWTALLSITTCEAGSIAAGIVVEGPGGAVMSVDASSPVTVEGDVLTLHTHEAFGYSVDTDYLIDMSSGKVAAERIYARGDGAVVDHRRWSWRTDGLDWGRRCPKGW